MRRHPILTALLALLLVVVALGYAESLRDPVVRRATIALAGLPEGTRPLRIALLSDLHVQGPDMPPARVRRIVDQVNAVHPDLILLAGDFVGSRRIATRGYSDAEIADALAGLRARLGVFAVLGNHDHWRDPASLARELAARNLRVLVNETAEVGPIAIAGIDDDFTDHADIARVAQAAAASERPVVVLTHSPDLVPRLPDGFALVLAGQTHCGQAVLPLIGAVVSSSRFGERYRCGLIREGSRTIVVTAGLGTSVLPMRLGAPPDWWLLTLVPKPAT